MTLIFRNRFGGVCILVTSLLGCSEGLEATASRAVGEPTGVTQRPTTAAVATAATGARSPQTMSGLPKAQADARRSGIDAPILWRPTDRDLGSESTGLCAGSSTPTLQLRELRADSNWLYIDVAHEDVMHDDKHQSKPAKLSVRTPDCVLTEPLVSGSVPRDWAAPSTLITSLASLPEGELYVTARVHDTQASFLIDKRGKTLRALSYRELSNVRIVPADPGTGLPPSIVYSQSARCSEVSL